MTDAWCARRRHLKELNEAEAKCYIDTIKAHVPSNCNPPYSIAGGLFDAPQVASGSMCSITNRAAEETARLFWTVEGCDLDPAAAVALASLWQAVAHGEVQRSELIHLNITGGGYKLLRDTAAVVALQADDSIDVAVLAWSDMADKIAEMLKTTSGVTEVRA